MGCTVTDREQEEAREAERVLLAKAMVENDADVIHVVAQAARMQQSTQKTQTLIVALLALVFAMLAIMSVATLITVVNYHRSSDTLNQVKNNTTVLKGYGKINKENGTLIRDCVTPKGVCYQAGQKRTSDAVGQIVQGDRETIIAAIVCSQDPAVNDIEACVDRKLARSAP